MWSLSLLLVFAAGWLHTHDFAGFLEQRIGAARGNLESSTLNRLRDFEFAKALVLAAAFIALLGAAAQYFARPIVRRLIQRPLPNHSGLSQLAMTAACGVLVFGRYYSTLEHGFFRYDDFDFLSVALEYPLRTAVWMPHGDHFYPLTRVAVSIAVQLFGVTTWPYNLGILLCFWTVAALACRLLQEFKVSIGGQFVFLIVFLFWSPWAEMLGGYYILSAYMAIAACGLGAVLGYFNWSRTRSKAAAAGVALSTGAATLIDTSGWYVPAALAVFFAASYIDTRTQEPLRTWLKRHRGLLLGTGGTVALCLIVTVLCYTVMNPGLFLSMSDSAKRTVGRLVADFVYLLDVGLLVSLAVPFIYARLPVPIIGGLALLAFLVALGFTMVVWRAADRRQRTTLIAIALVIAGSALMVNLGRPSGESLLVRWSAKHICPAYIWLCLFLALGWQILWNRQMDARRVAHVEVTLILLAAFCAAQTAFGAIGLAVSFPPFGYPGEIRDANIRRQNVDRLAHAIQKVRTQANGPAVLPTLDGSYINARHPSLFDYNLVRYAAFFSAGPHDLKFVRNSAMESCSGPLIETVPVLRDVVSPAFLTLLHQDLTLRDYYLAPIPLRAAPLEEIPGLNPPPVAYIIRGTGTRHENSLTLHSDGNVGLMIRDEPFDPEVNPRLLIQIERPSDQGSRDISIRISFRSDIGSTEVTTLLKLPASDKRPYAVDLRQIYGFTLSRRVSNLRIDFPESGHYMVRAAELTR